MSTEDYGVGEALTAGQMAKKADRPRWSRVDRDDRQDMILPAFLTAHQIADMLQVDERTVLRWAQRDASMPATRVGRVVRFEREPFLRWLARKRPRSAQGSRRSQDSATYLGGLATEI